MAVFWECFLCSRLKERNSLMCALRNKSFLIRLLTDFYIKFCHVSISTIQRPTHDWALWAVIGREVFVTWSCDCVFLISIGFHSFGSWHENQFTDSGNLFELWKWMLSLHWQVTSKQVCLCSTDQLSWVKSCVTLTVVLMRESGIKDILETNKWFPRPLWSASMVDFDFLPQLIQISFLLLKVFVEKMSFYTSHHFFMKLFLCFNTATNPIKSNLSDVQTHLTAR